MVLKITKSQLNGSIKVPPSKSHTLRALLFASLAHGKSEIHGYLHSPDTTAMIQACQQLGAVIEQTPNTLLIHGNGGIIQQSTQVDAGNSGLVLRLISAVAALSQQKTILSGDHSICHQRPMHALVDGLQQLGAKVDFLERPGYAPLSIQGPLKGSSVKIDGADSQPVSALLIASAFCTGNTHIEVANPGEKPWIDLTLQWFDRLGIRYEREGYTSYFVQGQQKISPFNYRVPGDWSSAAFPMVAALITHSELTITHLDLNDSQGDKKIVEILQSMGAKIEIGINEIKIKKGSSLLGKAIDINPVIDAIAVLAILGTQSEGETLLFNGAVARSKECDRIHCLAIELKKMGATIEERPDGLLIKKSPLNGAEVHSHHDHRLAMALALAGMIAQGITSIDAPQCIAKTYGSFVTDFKSIGACLEIL